MGGLLKAPEARAKNPLHYATFRTAQPHPLLSSFPKRLWLPQQPWKRPSPSSHALAQQAALAAFAAPRNTLRGPCPQPRAALLKPLFLSQTFILKLPRRHARRSSNSRHHDLTHGSSWRTQLLPPAGPSFQRTVAGPSQRSAFQDLRSWILTLAFRKHPCSSSPSLFCRWISPIHCPLPSLKPAPADGSLCQRSH